MDSALPEEGITVGVKTVVAYRNRFVTVYDDLVEFAGGEPGTFLRIVEGEGHPGVAALAIWRDSIALVRAYRYPIAAWEWGIPRGFAHTADPVENVRRELDEELGSEPDRLEPEPLIHIQPNSGLLAGTVAVFVAHYASPASTPKDRREIAEVKWPPFSQIRSDIVSGKITDGFTVAAVGAAVLRGDLKL